MRGEEGQDHGEGGGSRVALLEAGGHFLVVGDFVHLVHFVYRL